MMKSEPKMEIPKVKERLPTTPMKRSLSSRNSNDDEDDDDDDETRLGPSQKEMKMCRDDDEDDDDDTRRIVKEVEGSATDGKNFEAPVCPPPNPASHVLQETNIPSQIKDIHGEAIAGSISFSHRFHKQQKQQNNKPLFQKQQNGESPSKLSSQDHKNNTKLESSTPLKGSLNENTILNHHKRVYHEVQIISQAPHYGTGNTGEELVTIKDHPPNPL